MHRNFYKSYKILKSQHPDKNPNSYNYHFTPICVASYFPFTLSTRVSLLVLHHHFYQPSPIRHSKASIKSSMPFSPLQPSSQINNNTLELHQPVNKNFPNSPPANHNSRASPTKVDIKFPIPIKQIPNFFSQESKPEPN